MGGVKRGQRCLVKKNSTKNKKNRDNGGQKGTTFDEERSFLENRGRKKGTRAPKKKKQHLTPGKKNDTVF